MNLTNVIFLGPRLWDPDRTPPPERDPASCGDCGAHYSDIGAPCDCHEPVDVAA